MIPTKIEVLSRGIVCSNEESLHKYFGWPSVGRLKDGSIMTVDYGRMPGMSAPVLHQTIWKYLED